MVAKPIWTRKSAPNTAFARGYVLVSTACRVGDSEHTPRSFGDSHIATHGVPIGANSPNAYFGGRNAAIQRRDTINRCLFFCKIKFCIKCMDVVEI